LSLLSGCLNVFVYEVRRVFDRRQLPFLFSLRFHHPKKEHVLPFQLASKLELSLAKGQRMDESGFLELRKRRKTHLLGH
jgi:hypothetical protein